MFKNINILVIGDIVIDEYVYGKIERLNPEAPAPLVHCETYRKKRDLGAAGNVAKNFKGLGAKTDFLTNCGDSYSLIKTKADEYDIKLIDFKISSTTPIKQRIMVDGQQIIRVDFEDIQDLKKSFVTEFDKIKKELNNNYDAVILSDYNKGLFSYDLNKLIKQHFENTYTFADAKPNNFESFLMFDSIKTNFSEFQKYIKEDIPNDDEIIKQKVPLLKKKGINEYLLTRSEKGMSYIKDGEIYHSKTTDGKVHDITGAGDTVTAAFILKYLEKKSIKQALDFANKCSSIVISKPGCVSITMEDYIHHKNSLENLRNSFNQKTE